MLPITRVLNYIYYKYENYNYIDTDFNNYKIKTLSQFNEQRSGTCWDFVIAMAYDLEYYNIPYKCYYTVVHNKNKTVATHTYIIANKKCWIECSWKLYKGISTVDSYADVEDLLVDYYNGTYVSTVEYNPIQTQGMTDRQFFNYLELNNIEAY